jgi:hypothetical protein
MGTGARESRAERVAAIAADRRNLNRIMPAQEAEGRSRGVTRRRGAFFYCPAHGRRQIASVIVTALALYR